MKLNLRSKWLVLPLLLIVILMLADYAMILVTHGKTEAINITSIDNSVKNLKKDQIKVMTINMAHGRGNGKNQMRQSNTVIEENINAIGRLIAKEDAQVAALQEADAPSWWSGKYSHVNSVAKLGGMTSAIQGLHVDGLGLHYGTGIISQLKASNARQVTFEKNFPTLSKGFVITTFEWPGDSEFTFDVVSLHLDFANKGVREKQLSVLSQTIKDSKKPIILMGDFNSDISQDSLLNFVSENQLKTWKLNDQSIVTFPLLSDRIDWIFMSSEFNVVEHTVLDEVLSDHKIVTTVLDRRE